MSDLEQLRAAMQRFSAERDWEQFHDPKSLVLVLVGEGRGAGRTAAVPVSRPGAGSRPGADVASLSRKELADTLLDFVCLARSAESISRSPLGESLAKPISAARK